MRISSLCLSVLVFVMMSGCGAPEEAQRSPGGKEISKVDTPLACVNPDRAEKRLSNLKLLDDHGPFLTDKKLDRLGKFVSRGHHQDWCHDQFRESDIRPTGPIFTTHTEGEAVSTAYGTHARVRVYYSKQMVDWLQRGRVGAVPDGAMMVKEMYPSLEDDSAKAKPDGWAVMVKDSQASKDGWLWYLKYRLFNTPYVMPYQGGQYGASFCLSCHAAAEQGTFAAMGNLIEDDVATFVSLRQPRAITRDGRRIPSTHGRTAMPSDPSVLQSSTLGLWPANRCATASSMKDFYSCLLYSPVELPRLTPNPIYLDFFSKVVKHPLLPALKSPAALPMDGIYDHIPPQSADPHLFQTSSTCIGCHDASDLVNGTSPEMSYAATADNYDQLVLQRMIGEPSRVALSPAAEWTGSLMSVSARDPIFRAQLESETHLYPEHAAETTELCLSCHAPMGKRQFPELADNLANTLVQPHDAAVSKEAEFGALARDGVSCTVCHRMSPTGLGEPKTFNAQFNVAEEDVLFGPYKENVQTDPMQSAIGMKPMHGEHIQQSGLCGSCHMVKTPVYGEAEPDEAHEQTTYLEWRSSGYAKTPGQTCQSCHMSNLLPEDGSTTTRSKIANYEDSTFPFTANRKPSSLTDTVVREGYGRHSLLGLNLFTMNFFQQFPYLLGSKTFAPERAYADYVAPRALATYEVQKTAAHGTANVVIEDVEVTTDAFTIDVAVESMVGHKFPSGVGFRRAFLEVRLFDEAGSQVWCSGCTDELGVIVDHRDRPLPEEFPQESNSFLPDYRTITSSDQAQIYESRHTNAKQQLTTSFLELSDEVKDNRILPKGWNPSAYPEYEMDPVGASVEPEKYVDRVRYIVDKNKAGNAHSATVSLYYQAIPPYYLLDRIGLLSRVAANKAPETKRLLYLMTHLKIDGTSKASKLIKDWKLQIDRAKTVNLANPS